MPKKPTVEPNKLENGLLRVESSNAEGWLRLMIPRRGRYCAPCLNERNVCCGGKKTVHLRMESSLSYPTVSWFRARILDDEWHDFVTALDQANLQYTMNFRACMIVPCVMPLYCVQPCCFWYPFQLLERSEILKESALSLVVAKFNRYLFMPRGIVCRRQANTVPTSDGTGSERFGFLRFDLVPGNGPILHPSQLQIGYLPGTQEHDVLPLSREQWFRDRISLGEGYPCADAHPSCMAFIPRRGVQAFLLGNEREVNDAVLENRYNERHRLLWDPNAAMEAMQTPMPPPTAPREEDMYRA